MKKTFVVFLLFFGFSVFGQDTVSGFGEIPEDQCRIVLIGKQDFPYSNLFSIKINDSDNFEFNISKSYPVINMYEGRKNIVINYIYGRNGKILGHMGCSLYLEKGRTLYLYAVSSKFQIFWKMLTEKEALAKTRNKEPLVLSFMEGTL